MTVFTLSVRAGKTQEKEKCCSTNRHMHTLTQSQPLIHILIHTHSGTLIHTHSCTHIYTHSDTLIHTLTNTLTWRYSHTHFLQSITTTKGNT
jgi:N-acetyl-beta-hexosaminidase